MSSRLRPRRSVLYMPGSNSRAIDKGREIAADCLILDLEDAVHPDAKTAARDQVIAAVNQGDFAHREVVIRINGLETPWGQDDLRLAVRSGADAILLPKVESASEIEAVTDMLNRHGTAQMSVWAMAETPRGILDLDVITRNQSRLEVIVMGTSDLSKELRTGSAGRRSGLIHALSASVLAARANGLDIIDGVHLTLDDDEGFESACRQGRELGFDGKSLIHPRQIALANRIFGISQAEADHAREIETAWREASAAGKGVTIVRGQLIEQLHVDEAKRLLTLYSQMSARNERN